MGVSAMGMGEPITSAGPPVGIVDKWGAEAAGRG